MISDRRIILFVKQVLHIKLQAVLLAKTVKQGTVDARERWQQRGVGGQRVQAVTIYRPERGHAAHEVADRLGVSIHSMYSWIKHYSVPDEERIAADAQADEVRRLKVTGAISCKRTTWSRI